MVREAGLREVGVLEAKTHLSSLLDEVEGGAEVVITRHGRPVARVTRFAHPPRPPRLSGPELLARSLALRARLSAGGEDREPVSWEELKETGRT